jgi:hypothetical protein
VQQQKQKKEGGTNAFDSIEYQVIFLETSFDCVTAYRIISGRHFVPNGKLRTATTTQ